jgi:GTP-binding protein
MHIAILLENMRREGSEMQISQPNVIIKEKDGIKLEPFEEVTINVPEEMSGIVIKKLSRRSGNMIEMTPDHNNVKIIFEIPSRGLLGYRNEFIVDTSDEGIIYSRVIGFKPYVGDIKKNEVGSMVSMATGKALGFSLFNLQNRGTLYIKAGTQVYEGMVIGNTAKGHDLNVNPTKGKQLSNMRASGSDEAITLTPPTKLTLEGGMGIMREDEYLEITPNNIRLRKQFLTKNERVKAKRSK